MARAKTSTATREARAGDEEEAAMGDAGRRLFDGFDEQLLEQFYRPVVEREEPVTPAGSSGTTAAVAGNLPPPPAPMQGTMPATMTGTMPAAMPGSMPGTMPDRPVRARAGAASEKPRPTHYKICCISLYTEDIVRLEAMVAELKRRGHTKANKSQIIRAALDQLDLSKIPKGY